MVSLSGMLGFLWQRRLYRTTIVCRARFICMALHIPFLAKEWSSKCVHQKMIWRGCCFFLYLRIGDLIIFTHGRWHMHQYHIAGVFKNASDAQSVINALAQAGISRADIGLYPSVDIPMNADITTASATEHSRAPLVQLFRSMLDMDDEGEQYSRLFSRYIDQGCFVVTIQLEDETQLDVGVDVMNRFEPVSVQEAQESTAKPASEDRSRRGAIHVFRRRAGGSEAS